MTQPTLTDLAAIQAPAGEPRLIDVRTNSGDRVGRVTEAKGQQLIAAGLVFPIGRRAVKYLVLRCDEPTLEHGWHGGSRTTEVDRDVWGDRSFPRSGYGRKHRALAREY